MLIATVESIGYKASKVICSLGLVCIVNCTCLPLGCGADVYAELNGYLEANDATQQMSIWASTLLFFVVTVVWNTIVFPLF